MVLFPKNPPHPFSLHSTCAMQCICVQQCLSTLGVLMYDMSVTFQLIPHATYPRHASSSTYTQTHSTHILHFSYVVHTQQTTYNTTLTTLHSSFDLFVGSASCSLLSICSIISTKVFNKCLGTLTFVIRRCNCVESRTFHNTAVVTTSKRQCNPSCLNVARHLEHMSFKQSYACMYVLWCQQSVPALMYAVS
jgi:hypothetical protein